MNSEDIAKIAGVSRSTVSRVINNYPNVPARTKEKVMKVIEKYEYVPQASARLLAGSKNKIIGLFIIDINREKQELKYRISRNPYYSDFINSVIETASELGYTVLVDIIHNKDGFDRIKENFINKTISGGIFVGQKNNDKIIKSIIEQGYKVVLIDQEINKNDNIYNDAVIVNADNFNGSYLATNYLISTDHRKIAHITGDVDKHSSIARLNGYKKALEDSLINLNRELIIEGKFVQESGYLSTKKLLEKNEKFTAILASNDQIAVGAIKALKENNIAVPEDVSVIGFDNIELAKYLKPALTSVDINFIEMGAISARLLTKYIEFDEKEENVTVPVSLVERESCK